MRTTDKKGAIIGTVLAIIVIATMLLLIAFVDVDTAEASSDIVQSGQFFYLEYGRIQAIEPIDESYEVILTYYDNGENIEENNRVKTAKIQWSASFDRLVINDVIADIHDTILHWTYFLDIYAENMEDIRLFDKAFVINSKAEELYQEGIAYYAIKSIKPEVPPNYTTYLGGKFVYLGYDVYKSTAMDIVNGKVTFPDTSKYNVAFCSNVKDISAPPFVAGNRKSLNDIFNIAQVAILVDYGNDYMNGYNEGVQFADGRVNKNSASYINGYEAGQQGQYTFLNLMTAVVDAPVKAIAGIFNIEVLGYNMLYFVTGLLTIGLIFFIVRKLGGGL